MPKPYYEVDIREMYDESDEAFYQILREEFDKTEQSFEDLIIDVSSDEAFNEV